MCAVRRWRDEPRGDSPIDGPTDCDGTGGTAPSACLENEHVHDGADGYECSPCAAGRTRPAGDNPIDGLTFCSCAQDEYCGNGTVMYLSADELCPAWGDFLFFSDACSGFGETECNDNQNC